MEYIIDDNNMTLKWITRFTPNNIYVFLVGSCNSKSPCFESSICVDGWFLLTLWNTNVLFELLLLFTIESGFSRNGAIWTALSALFIWDPVEWWRFPWMIDIHTVSVGTVLFLSNGDCAILWSRAYSFLQRSPLHKTILKDELEMQYMTIFPECDIAQSTLERVWRI